MAGLARRARSCLVAALVAAGGWLPSSPAGAVGLEAIVAARTIRKGETVTPDALGSVAVRSLPTRRFVHDPAEAHGKVARRTIVRGRLIPRAALADADDVARGETVTLLYSAGALTISVPATALSGGRVGDAIGVRVPATGGRAMALVTSADTAELLR